jgi:exosome complex exonuclease RRP6
MADYARADTHYLLYCYDNLRNELVEKSKSAMDSVLQQSKEVALRTYERLVYDAETGNGPYGWKMLLLRKNYPPIQEAVIKALHAWRDRVAREEDEGAHFVMPVHTLLNISATMPTDVASALKLCSNALQKRRVQEIVTTIQQVLERQSVRETTDSKRNEISMDIFGETRPSDVMSDTSGFWGGIIGSSKWETNGEQSSANGEVRLALPLPDLTAAQFVSVDDTKSPTFQKPIDPGARAEHEYVKDRGGIKKNDDDIITVKALGGGRKRKMGQPLQEQGNDASEECTHLEVEGQERIDTGNDERKKKRKTGDAAGNIDENPVEAFDYSKAPSILNSNKRNEDKGGKIGGPKKPFDPYTKFGDAPRRMNRGQRERAGKSHTFRN